MTPEEYEQRKLRLQEQLRAGIALLEAGYQERLRALETDWRAASGESPEVLPAAPAAAPSKPARRRAGQLAEEVEAALPRLPERFDRNDVCAALGYEPDRASLFKVLRSLTKEGELAIERKGQGQVPTIFRKLETGGAAG